MAKGGGNAGKKETSAETKELLVMQRLLKPSLHSSHALQVPLHCVSDNPPSRHMCQAAM